MEGTCSTISLTKDGHIHHDSQEPLQTDKGVQVEFPTQNEIKQAIKMKISHKAPGKDGIPAQRLGQGGAILTQTLHQLICIYHIYFLKV
jgi:flagellar basal body rod protein FlgG